MHLIPTLLRFTPTILLAVIYLLTGTKVDGLLFVLVLTAVLTLFIEFFVVERSDFTEPRTCGELAIDHTFLRRCNLPIGHTTDHAEMRWADYGDPIDTVQYHWPIEKHELQS